MKLLSWNVTPQSFPSASHTCTAWSKGSVLCRYRIPYLYHIVVIILQSDTRYGTINQFVGRFVILKSLIDTGWIRHRRTSSLGAGFPHITFAQPSYVNCDENILVMVVSILSNTVPYCILHGLTKVLPKVLLIFLTES